MLNLLFVLYQCRNHDLENQGCLKGKEVTCEYIIAHPDRISPEIKEKIGYLSFLNYCPNKK